MSHTPQNAIPEKPCTATVRCKAGDVPGVRGGYLRGSKILILFSDGRTFEDVTAAQIDGQWHDVVTVDKKADSASYVLHLA